ncbi:MAG: DUF411 domain-containing protein [Rhodothermaceae bacterium]|nr:DUF411 domain-containing protein [Rhodothermaceae bacterium]MXZ58821.1 DUF411 domain-containing protein [Rhodothermaceae bacterium]MYB92173.1 DUF411 domain-containing protein [Rhodothermaceae bacterium]MYD67323.1 DUF411 domain-containing protein [Rhodothermaceae bacterium]MYG44718.1 DUF411 domain-containing protein [Rhodothermaceae bacterium]
MKRAILIVLTGVGLCAVAIVGFTLRPGGQEVKPTMVVYKSPTCGCCVKWAEHMEAAGFEVESRNMRAMGSIKAELGVPQAAHSCHTAVVDGYIVEGHVPAAYVHKLLEERPDIPGIAVPGMPIGSPGMEGPNAQPYEIVTFNEETVTGVYAQVDP